MADSRLKPRLKFHAAPTRSASEYCARFRLQSANNNLSAGKKRGPPATRPRVTTANERRRRYVLQVIIEYSLAPSNECEQSVGHALSRCIGEANASRFVCL